MSSPAPETTLAANMSGGYRVLKTGGCIVCMVPSQALYEKRRALPSIFNADHKRLYKPSSLLRSFGDALEVNSYRIDPDTHPDGAYEIELVSDKIRQPDWALA